MFYETKSYTFWRCATFFFGRLFFTRAKRALRFLCKALIYSKVFSCSFRSGARARFCRSHPRDRISIGSSLARHAHQHTHRPIGRLTRPVFTVGVLAQFTAASRLVRKVSYSLTIGPTPFCRSQTLDGGASFFVLPPCLF